MNRKAFYDALRADKRVFGGSLSASQVTGINGILDAFATHGDGREKTLAYALATAYHETGRRMVPVREGFASTDAGARRAVNNLAKKRGPNSAVARYARPDTVTGHVYYGRGHVQLTWKDNYKQSSGDAGVDLVANPDAMLDPVISARVLIKGLIDGRWNGLRKGIAHYLPDNGPDDKKNARRTVNVLDKWQDIAGYYDAFLAAIRKGGGVSEIEPAPVVPPKAKRVVDDAAASDRISTTEIVAIGTGVSGTATAVREVVTTVNETGKSLVDAGPWVVVALIIVGFAVYIWSERRRKKRLAREAMEG
jgi:hypothetical protein